MRRAFATRVPARKTLGFSALARRSARSRGPSRPREPLSRGNSGRSRSERGRSRADSSGASGGRGRAAAAALAASVAERAPHLVFLEHEIALLLRTAGGSRRGAPRRRLARGRLRARGRRRRRALGETEQASVCAAGAVVKASTSRSSRGTSTGRQVKAAGMRLRHRPRQRRHATWTPSSTPNWSGMKAAGLVRGVYQFFEPGEDPTTQANIVIRRWACSAPAICRPRSTWR